MSKKISYTGIPRFLFVFLRVYYVLSQRYGKKHISAFRIESKITDYNKFYAEQYVFGSVAIIENTAAKPEDFLKFLSEMKIIGGTMPNVSKN